MRGWSAARAEADEHDVGRAVVVVGVAKLRHLTGGGPGGIGLKRQVGVFVELELIPRFAVVRRDENAEHGNGKKNDQDRPVLQTSHLLILLLLRVLTGCQPVFQGRTGAHIPGDDFFGEQRFDKFQFIAEFYFALSLDVIGKNNLVTQFESIVPDKTNDLSIQAEFFLNFTKNTVFRRFTFFEKACHDAQPFLRPAFVASQNDFAFVFNNGRHNRDRAIPMNEIAGWALLAFYAFDLYDG